MKAIQGGCACGAVRYEVRGPLRPIIACHCTQCRRTSGHFFAATACRRSVFALLKSATLKWFVAVPGSSQNRTPPAIRQALCTVKFWYGS
jgi:hypothetical protein